MSNKLLKLSVLVGLLGFCSTAYAATNDLSSTCKTAKYRNSRVCLKYLEKQKTVNGITYNTQVGAVQDSTNIAAWASCGYAIVKSVDTTEKCVYTGDEANYNTQRTYNVRYDYYGNRYWYGETCKNDGNYSNVQKTPLTSCPSFCDKKRSLEKEIATDSEYQTTKSCDKGGTITYTYKKYLAYDGKEYSNTGEYFYDAAECSKWGTIDKVISTTNNCSYSKSDGSYEWTASASDLDSKGRLKKWNLIMTQPTQSFNFKLLVSTDNENQTDMQKLFTYHYPKIFADVSKIRWIRAYGLTNNNVPVGIAFKTQISSELVDYVAPNGKVIGKTDKIPSSLDYVLQPAVDRNCGIMKVNIDSTDPATGEAVKPIYCTNGTRYDFSDIEWKSAINMYDMTENVRKGLIPYVFFIQQANHATNTFRITFEVEYYD